ncbi:MAG: SH3 domain-containing protein [Pseudomonadota bacterium]|jgi:hypothetical protein
MSDKKGGPKELNLGLTALLSKATDAGLANQDGVKSGSEHPRSETEIVTVDDDLQALTSELSQLADKGQWGMIVSRAESAIASEEDIEARLWWIRGHLGAFTLPVSLLAAPFETVCRQLVGDPRVDIYEALLREIGEIALVRLRDVGDRRQEHSVRLALYRLGVIEADEAAEKLYGKVPPKVPRLEPRFELGDAQQQQRTVIAERASVAHKRRPLRFALVASALFTLLLGGIWFWRYTNVAPSLLLAQEDLLGSQSPPGMLPPFVVARPVSSSLGALYYSIDKGDLGASQKPAQPATVAGGTQGASTTTSAPTTAANSYHGANQKHDNRSPQAAQSEKRRESVRTDGPIEGPEFTRGVERETVPQAKLPEVLPEVQVNPLPNHSYPDGSLNVGGEIKSALVQTDVFDSASSDGRVIARLVPGDKVSVEGRIGQWYRIRSRRGRAGFVFAQDIGELEDFQLNSDRN